MAYQLLISNNGAVACRAVGGAVAVICRGRRRRGSGRAVVGEQITSAGRPGRAQAAGHAATEEGRVPRRAPRLRAPPGARPQHVRAGVAGSGVVLRRQRPRGEGAELLGQVLVAGCLEGAALVGHEAHAAGARLGAAVARAGSGRCREAARGVARGLEGLVVGAAYLHVHHKVTEVGKKVRNKDGVV